MGPYSVVNAGVLDNAPRRAGEVKALVFIVCLFLCSVPNPVQAADGDLDPTFGIGGKVTTDFFEGSDDWAAAVAIRPDGKIVAVGYTYAGASYDFGLVCYNADGTLDPAFGMVSTDFGSDDSALALAVQPDGKVVAAGYTYGALAYDFALVRYGADGTLDPTFGVDGKVITDFLGGSYDYANAVAVQPDGKVVVAGWVYVPPSWDFALARYNTDGTLDPTFGADGKVTTDFFGGHDYAYALSIQTDGRIVAAGRSRSGSYFDFALARYTMDGKLDPTFGSGGKVTTDCLGQSDYARAIAIQTDGKIIAAGVAFGSIAGDYYQDFALARYHVDGTLDTTFGTVSTDFGSDDSASALAIQADGKIVAVGLVYGEGGVDFGLARFNTDGTLDTAFGTGGKVNTDFFDNEDVAGGVSIQADGKIIVAGAARGELSSDFALARYDVYAAPPSPQTVIEDLRGDVRMLSDSGILTQGRAQALTVKLDAALMSLDRGNAKATCGQIQAFVNQVNAFIRSGILTLEQGQVLIDSARNVATEIG